jgi:hypothetical protein
MDQTILKKRLSTFRNDEGRLVRVSDELLMDILRAWENWTGSGKDFYIALGISKQTLGCFIKKAKKLNRAGVTGELSAEFKEIALSANPQITPNCLSIELVDQGKVIRFPQVDQLIEFLKKAA